MRKALVSLLTMVCSLFLAVSAYASDDIAPPAMSGKVVESVSLISDFKFTPGQWQNCEEEPSDSLTLHRCKLSGAKIEIKNSTKDTIIVFPTGNKIDAIASMQFSQYYLHGAITGGVKVLLTLIYHDESQLWHGTLAVGNGGDMTTHPLTLDSSL